MITPGPLDQASLALSSPTVQVGQTQQFTATALDEFDNPIPGLKYVYGALGQAKINNRGSFAVVTTAGGYADASTVEVTQGSITSSTTTDLAIPADPQDHMVITSNAGLTEM